MDDDDREVEEEEDKEDNKEDDKEDDRDLKLQRDSMELINELEYSLPQFLFKPTGVLHALIVCLFETRRPAMPDSILVSTPKVITMD